jgi:hypothetical protein
MNSKDRWQSDTDIPHYALHGKIYLLHNANSTQIMDSLLQKPEAKQECYQGINTEFEWVSRGGGADEDGKIILKLN